MRAYTVYHSISEQAGVNQGENFGFIRYFRDGMKASMSSFTEEEISMAQFPMARLNMSLQEAMRKNQEMNTIQYIGNKIMSCD